MKSWFLVKKNMILVFKKNVFGKNSIVIGLIMCHAMQFAHMCLSYGQYILVTKYVKTKLQIDMIFKRPSVAKAFLHTPPIN